MLDQHDAHMRIGSQIAQSRSASLPDFLVVHRRERDQRMHDARFHQCGAVAGKLFACVALVDTWVHRAIAWAQPAEEIDVAPDVPAGAL